MEEKVREFYRSVEENDLASVQQLLKDRVNSDEPNWCRNGKPAILEASYRGLTDMVRLLLDSGADPNAQNMLGETALHNAFHPASFSKPLVSLLLDAGANVDAKEKLNGCSVLHSAARFCGGGANSKMRRDALEVLRIVCDRADVNLRNARQETALHRLVSGSGDWVEPVLALVESGADPNARNDRGETALMCAIDKGHRLTAEALIKKGADVDVRDRHRQTALHHSAQKNLLPTLDLLLEAGADCNARDLNGDTALHIAASKGLADMVGRLVSHRGAAVNVQNAAGSTPLQNAVESGFAGVVQLLLEGYCEVECEKGLLTALDVAEEDFVRRWHPEICKLLQEALDHRRDLWDEGETSL